MPIVTNAQSKELVVDVLEKDIATIQAAVARGYLNYEMLATIYLERIAAYDQAYNSLITINEKILEEARLLDKEYQERGPRSLLHGIPVIVKDNIDVKGMPTTAGAKALLDNYPKENAPIVQKLIDNGAIIIGKANMSEFAFSARNSYSSFGHVYNAFNSKYTSYGSSGGTAVAIALGFAPIGLGTDTNASLRTPASAAALTSLRPTYGSIEMAGIIPYDAERDIAGVMGRYVSDVKLVNEILQFEEKQFKSSQNIKIGVLNDLMSNKTLGSANALRATNSEIITLMMAAIAFFDDYGIEIVKLDKVYNDDLEKLRRDTFGGVFFCYDFNQYLKNTTGSIRNYNDLLASGQFVQNLSFYNISCNFDLRTQRLATINAKKDEYTNYWYQLMDANDVDVLLYPTTKNRLPLIGNNQALINSGIIAPTTGMPALNVPLGFIDELPYGMEMVSKHHGEQLLFYLASLWEEENNYYYVPEPALYEVCPLKLELKEWYDKFYQSSKYEQLNERARQLFISESDDVEINSLIVDYKNHHIPDYYEIMSVTMASKFWVVGIIIIFLISGFVYRKIN